MTSKTQPKDEGRNSANLGQKDAERQKHSDKELAHMDETGKQSGGKPDEEKSGR